MMSKIQFSRTQQWLYMGLALCIGISGCGGSGAPNEQSSDLSSNDSSELSVELGNAQTTTVLSEINLKGAVFSDKQITQYKWSIVPNEYESALSASDTESITFIAPEVTINTDMMISLVVADIDGNTATASKNILVKPLNTSPESSLIVLGSNDQTSLAVDSGEGFQLSANWLDAQDGVDLQSAELFVTQVRGEKYEGLPADGLLRDLSERSQNLPTTEVISSNQYINQTDGAMTLEFTLKVTDKNGATHQSSVKVDILPLILSKPIISAGDDIIAYEGQPVFLTGVNNIAIEDNTADIEWWQSAGTPIVAISDKTSNEISFIAPKVDNNEILSFSYKVTNNKGVSVDSVNVTILSLSAFNEINDTGIVNCANNESNDILVAVPCDFSAFPQQDAEIGRDPAYTFNQSLNKIGEGEGGFDFTRINAQGDELSSSEIANTTCIRDNTSNLTWEVKVASGYRAYNSSFSWFYENSEVNGGFSGSENAGSCTLGDGLLSCDTAAYISAVNNNGLCGVNDWRLPTVNELSSILNYGRISDKFAQNESSLSYWPNHSSATEGYWTSQSSAVGVSTELSLNAWLLNTDNGNDFIAKKSSPARVLLVRGN